MHIQDSETAHFFGITPSEGGGYIESFSRKLIQIPNKEDGIILFGQERTLYDYSLLQMYNLYQKVGSDILMILCSSLTAARGSGERRWINTQQNISNFNVNICLKVPHTVSHSVWNLQERIAVGISQILTEMTPQSEIRIAYPFHYLMDGGKVAGHLVQKVKLDSDNDFLRIGIGVNTAPIPPILPENDQLAKDIFCSPKSLDITPKKWIELAKRFTENINASFQGDSRHQEYLEYLTLRKGDTVGVFQDNGTAQFGKQLFHGRFDILYHDGSLEIDNSIIKNGEYHIKNIQNRDHLVGGL